MPLSELVRKEAKTGAAAALVRDAMSPAVRTCRLEDNLATAAAAMWEQDCGCLPVVAEDGRLVGTVTDRDICMAAYTQGVSLQVLPVSLPMAREPATCRPTDTLEDAAAVMSARQVRRLPVVEDGGRLVGILSLADLARHAARRRRARSRTATDVVALTLAAICESRSRRDAGA